MEKRELEQGDVVQINPEHDPKFGAALMIVSEPKTFGAQGYVHCWTEDGEPARAYYRCHFAGMEYIGRAEWVAADEREDNDHA